MADGPNTATWKPNQVTTMTVSSAARRAMSNEWAFAIVFIVVNLHTLRRASNVGYLFAYSLVAASSIFAFLNRRKYRELKDGGLLLAGWIVIAIAGFVTTIATTSLIAGITGLTRFLFAIPIFLALVAFTDSLDEFRNHLSIIIVFYTLGALTIPLQEFTGPITWFATSSERAGFERYGSLLGALSVVGGTVALYMLLQQESKLKARPAFLSIMALSALLSLSKAAIGGVALGILGLLIVNYRSLGRWAITIALSAFLVLAVLSVNSDLTSRISAVSQSYGISLTGEQIASNDASIEEGITERLTTRPAQNFAALKQFNSPFVYIVGAGYGMGGLTLVDREEDVMAPQAHNQYAELVTIFGPVGGAMLILMVITIVVRLWRAFHSRKLRIYFSFLVIMFVWMLIGLFGGGSFFQPAMASILWISIFCAFTKVSLEPRGNPIQHASEGNGVDGHNVVGTGSKA